MRKSYSVLSFLIMGLLFSITGLKAQSIDIINYSDNPALPTSICQCDTLDGPGGLPNRLRYFISAPGFNPTTDFYFELASPNNNWAMTDTIDWLGVEDVAGTPIDSFAAGDKYAVLAIPCNAPLGPATLRIRNSSGVISDTIYFNINRIPLPVVIDTIIGGFPNPYTTTLNDWGFCTGDSVIMVVEPQIGASYQWLAGGVPMAGETGETLIVKNSGNYTVRVDLGACTRDSKDTLINSFLPPTSIQLISGPPDAFQIDNPIPQNISPDDSIQFCATESFILRANGPIPATGLTYTYQWLTDSVTQFGDRVFYPTDTADTLQTVVIDSSNIVDFDEQRFYVAIYDGFCTDTSQLSIKVYTDTVPRTRIINRKWSNGVLGPPEFGLDVCMKDSVRLRAEMTGPNWEYQWQRFNTSLGVYQNLPNASNPNLDGTLRTLPVDTSLKPISNLSWYRLMVTTVTPQGDAVCTYTSDTIRVRWFPEYDLTFQPDPWVFSVGQDSINFCATDSALLVAPVTPTQLVNNGLNYAYQWLKDTVDTLGNTIQAPITGETARTFRVHKGGKYYVVIDDGICLDTSDVYWVFVDSIPVTSILPRPFVPGNPTPDFNLCLTDSLLLSAVDTVLPGWKYEWQSDFGLGWGSKAGDTLPYMIVDTSYAPFGGNDTIYFRLRVEYENRFGNTICPYVSDSVQVIFFNPPNISFFPDDTVTLCAGDSVLVIAQGNSNTYIWDDGTIGAQNFLSTPGFHTVAGSGINGCIQTESVFVQLFNTQANAGPDLEVFSGQTATLAGSGGTNYRWYANKPIAWSDFLSQNVNVSYTLPDGVKIDTVIIYLQVTNSVGCTDLDSMRLIVRANEAEDLSLIDQAWNVFTPNNDGVNDLWDISAITKTYGICKVTIMNRWGSTVYEEDPFDGVWEGVDQGGADLPDGTYYYILSCDDKIILKNAVSLIRNQQ